MQILLTDFVDAKKLPDELPALPLGEHEGA